MYHLPLLPGYVPNVNVRSSIPAKTIGGENITSQFIEAEENGYEGTYFTSEDPNEPLISSDGFIPSITPDELHGQGPNSYPGLQAPNLETISESPEMPRPRGNRQRERKPQVTPALDENVAEVIFFAYGVVVFFGFQESEERAVLEDIENADIFSRKIEEDAWEVEECHYAVSVLV